MSRRVSHSVVTSDPQAPVWLSDDSLRFLLNAISLMGFSGLARWASAPTTGIDLIHQNLLRNHQAQYRGKWHMSVRTYRSTLGNVPGYQVQSERSMTTITMDDRVFVLLDDPAAPSRAEYLEHLTSGHNYSPSHFRSTFLTVGPPGALEQLLTQLRARWVPVRRGTGSGQGTGQQLAIDGNVYTIGSDWIVRAGNIVLAGGAVKGLVLEAEYLPMPLLRETRTDDGTAELVTNMLVSMLVNTPEAGSVRAITSSDSVWSEVLWDREEEREQQAKEEKEKRADPDGDIYVSDDDLAADTKEDWTGVDRDRRSAYLIVGALRTEGLL